MVCGTIAHMCERVMNFMNSLLEYVVARLPLVGWSESVIQLPSGRMPTVILFDTSHLHLESRSRSDHTGEINNQWGGRKTCDSDPFG
jgi:hypothetical protein